MTARQRVWRDGFAPQISDAGLAALRAALAANDPRLIQGASTRPPPMNAVLDWPAEGACAVGYCGWQCGNTVGEVEHYFADACYQADRRLGEPAACRWFLNWYDDEDRAVVFAELLREVDREISRRAAGVAA